jgi:hypothetical protein
MVYFGPMRSLVVPLVLLASCGTPKAEPDPAAAASESAAAVAASQKPAVVRTGKAEIILAPEGDEDLAAVVKREIDRAKADQKDLLVYVGATWCEPCQRLHKAIVDGDLDKEFPGMRLLEFDADRDDVRLRRSGYLAKYIPMLAVPRDDGTASGKQIEGSVKGPRALDVIKPKLRGLIDKNMR